MLDRMFTSLRAYIGAFAAASPGGRVVDIDGVSAAIVPAMRDRSVVNSVVYRDAEVLEARLGEIAAVYDEAGIGAWTVWAHADDERAARALAAAGNVLDASPMAMARELPASGTGGDIEPPADGELDLVDDPEPAQMAAVLAEAYHWPTVGEALVRWPEGYRPYIARAGGQPAATLAIVDVGGDASVTWVGTVERARGRGLATLLLRHALADAQERGCEITTLQATRMGHPIYAGLGYRDMGPVNMWERRKPEAAGRAA